MTKVTTTSPLQQAADAAREALADTPYDATVVAIRCSELLAAVDEELAERELRKRDAEWQPGDPVIIACVDGETPGRYVNSDGAVTTHFLTALAALKWVREQEAEK